jgi:hypothetical protein
MFNLSPAFTAIDVTTAPPDVSAIDTTTVDALSFNVDTTEAAPTVESDAKLPLALINFIVAAMLSLY